MADLSLDKEVLKAVIVKKRLELAGMRKDVAFAMRAVRGERAPGLQARGTWIAAVIVTSRDRITTRDCGRNWSNWLGRNRGTDTGDCMRC